MFIKNKIPFYFYIKRTALFLAVPYSRVYQKHLFFSCFCKFSFTNQRIITFILLFFNSDLFLFLIIFSDELIYFTFPIDLNSTRHQVLRGDAATIGESACKAAIVDFALAAGGAFFF